MDDLDFRDIHLDDCPQCGGIWFDDGELRKVQTMGDELCLQSLEDQAHPHKSVVCAESEAKMCPVCNERLVPYKYMYSSDVILDECDNCFGLWVQDGELIKMAEYLDHEQAAMSPAKREVIAAVSAEVQMAMRSKKNRAKSVVAFWSVFGMSRTGRAI
jgi:Zn-finger nucleic acid-binding protein